MAAPLMNRMESLDMANVIRSKRSTFRHRAKRLHVQAAILSPSAWMKTATIQWALLICPGVGKVKAGEILRRAGVSPSRRLDSLSPGQRLAIVKELR
jgi:hypothetical protein